MSRFGPERLLALIVALTGAVLSPAAETGAFGPEFPGEGGVVCLASPDAGAAAPVDPGRFLRAAALVAEDPATGAVVADARSSVATDRRLAVALALRGLAASRSLLSGELGLDLPSRVRVVLADLEPDVQGFRASRGGDPGVTLVVSVGDGSANEIAARIGHLLAHEALGGIEGLTGSWEEAVATWVGLRLRRDPDRATIDSFDHRLRRIGAGLLTRSDRLASGNALWLAFIDEAYGPLAVRAMLDGFARGDDPPEAIERGVRAAAGMSLEAAFREFHLWCVLTGDRSLGTHFPFADRLGSVRFSNRAEGLPALDDPGEPLVGPWGAAQILVRPDAAESGMTVRVEGDLPGVWEADLILMIRGGWVRRVPLDLSDDARGEVTVPLTPLVSEAILLVRRFGGDPVWEADAPLRFSWSARYEAGFPWILGEVGAYRDTETDEAVAVSWTTESEHDLVGFNVLRTELPSRRTVRVNPIRIPAIGDLSTESSYRFVDASASAGTTSVYRVEAVTAEGLTALSEPVAVRSPGER